MPDITESFAYRIVYNKALPSCRGRIAQWLRVLAQRLDGAETVSIRIETAPDIGRATKLECIRQGFNVIEQSVCSEVKERAFDRVMKRCRPELFDDVPHR